MCQASRAITAQSAPSRACPAPHIPPGYCCLATWCRARPALPFQLFQPASNLFLRIPPSRLEQGRILRRG
eukprot:1191595-Prorocentrum_minimum.AAC.3